MSTRARIGRRNDDGSISSIYLHCDGYPARALRTLVDEYADQQAVDRLPSAGDLSSFGAPLREPSAGMVSHGLEDYLQDARRCWAEHAYLFEGGTWLHSSLKGGSR
jgi:hypothetical protein